VTGGSSGIGRAIALELAAAGADVLVNARRSREGAEETARRVEALGRAAPVVMADLSTLTGCRKLLEAAWKRLGPVDIWVNNAGADILTGGNLALQYEEKLRRLLEVDVLATVRLSRAAGSRMRAHGEGVIINMGWDGAWVGMGGDSGELFAASKAAVMGFTASLALSLAPRVRVNCLAPGWIRTAWGSRVSRKWQELVARQTPLARWGTPEDVARAARFLASPAASYITGQVIAVNGGAARPNLKLGI
jgi:3-oxoacyl-[acyl-carrier protein] reductase